MIEIKKKRKRKILLEELKKNLFSIHLTMNIEKIIMKSH